jgi:hypothetical protein
LIEIYSKIEHKSVGGGGRRSVLAILAIFLEVKFCIIDKMDIFWSSLNNLPSSQGYFPVVTIELLLLRKNKNAIEFRIILPASVCCRLHSRFGRAVKNCGCHHYGVVFLL